ncbi:MAG: hypothetical protein ACLVHS_00030 [Blautia wexlerae]
MKILLFLLPKITPPKKITNSREKRAGNREDSPVIRAQPKETGTYAAGNPSSTARRSP